MNNLYYTGVGSRSTPSSIMALMSHTASVLENHGYTLRSGGAPGADYAFEEGVVHDCNKEIWVPWIGFNSNNSTNIPSARAYDIASTVHPAWDRLKESHRLLHARNIHQVLGADLNTPSSFLICWTENADVKGGTATAIRLAHRYNIPVINIGVWRNDITLAADGLECALAIADPENLLTINLHGE